MIEDTIEKILTKENFIINRHFECHNANHNGDCSDCNRKDTISELKNYFIKELQAQRKEIIKEIIEWAEGNCYEAEVGYFDVINKDDLVNYLNNKLK